jgi:hypothetical protein
MRIKTGVIIIDLGIFDENFIIFEQVEVLKKIRAIKGRDSIKGFFGYNLGIPRGSL